MAKSRTTHDLKVLLSRSERRALDRAAKASGRPTGAWLRALGLAAAITQPEPLKPSQRPSNAPQENRFTMRVAAIPCKLCGGTSTMHRPACPSYELTRTKAEDTP